MSSGGLTLSVQPLPDAAELARRWQSLESRAEPEFFLSWPWIGTWVDMVRRQCPLELLCVQSRGEDVALAVWSRKLVRHRGLFKVRQGLINITGTDALDDICIEHNGLLVGKAQRDEVWARLGAGFLSGELGCDELRLDGFEPELVASAERAGAMARTHIAVTGRYIDLEALRAEGSDPLDKLSPAARKQLRKTQRRLEASHGPLQLQCANDLPQAQLMFEELAAANQKRWQETGDSAFGNRFYLEFHRQLLARHFPGGAIQMLRVLVGQRTIGWLYNFVFRGRIYSYQSGTDYDVVQRSESPGMLMHLLAIRFNSERGCTRYEMLGNDAEYKRRLCSGELGKWWGSLRRPLWHFRLERALIAARRGLRARGNPPPG